MTQNFTSQKINRSTWNVKLFIMSRWMDSDKPFTVQQGFDIQIEQLNQWKSILKHEKYLLLHKWIDGCNMSININSTGYDVVRGNEIDNWIMNNLMER